MREFVAIDVGAAAEKGRGPASPHLTLRFLGEVAPDRNEAITRVLGDVARTSPPFRLRLEGIGAFPTPSQPRVVWVGVTVGRAELAELARRIRLALEPEFGPDREEFVPHLTLFRVRSPSDRTAAVELLSGARPAPPPREVTVEQLLLKESLLGPTGAVHRTLATFPLVGRRSAPG